MYVYVGGTGTAGTSYSSSIVPGGWNGGGNGAVGSGAYSSGGGATDISLQGTINSTTWKENNHLYSRVIVAGGGGGHAQHSGASGGAGGGTQGINGSGSCAMGCGGTQTNYGRSNDSCWYANESAGFGFGGRGGDTHHSGYGCGGGRRRLVWWPEEVKTMEEPEAVLDGYSLRQTIQHGKMEIQQMQINIY